MAVAGCPGPPGDPYRDAAYDTANVSPYAYLEGLDPVATCTLSPTDPAYEQPIETLCDGLDNDCDGLVDKLIPLGPNACATGLLGACATGWASCVLSLAGTSERVCYGPAPTPEVADGIDNDCNGMVDDLPLPAAASPRILVAVTSSAWSNYSDQIATLQSVMDQWGIPYDVPAQSQDFDTTIASIGQYSVVVIPGGISEDDMTAADAMALTAFAQAGHVVILTTPDDASDTGNTVLTLAGLTATAENDSATFVVFDGPIVTATGLYDSVEERNIPLTADATIDQVPIEILTPGPGTTVLAHAFAGLSGSVPLGVVATARPLGAGAVYTLGSDMVTYETNRCYINCFDPSLDEYGLFLRESLRQGSAGHVVFKHTVPGVQDSMVTLTHDMDAPDAQNSGPWGPPGGVQMAEMERAHNAYGTYEFTTDYVVGYWNPDTAVTICNLGMCPLGAHSVEHMLDIGSVPYGIGNETYDTYDPLNHETLSGEVRVSQQLLTQVTGVMPRVWRSPYLDVNPLLFKSLGANQYDGDSSFATGDWETNLPFNVGHVGFYQEIFLQQDIEEYCISSEDGIGSIDPNGVEHRIELQRNNIRQFLSNWTYIALRNAANRAMDVVLIHPSYGVGVGSDNQQEKIIAGDRILRTAEAAHLMTDTFLEPLTLFWHARDRAALSATWDGHAYQGTVAIGETITNLTLEFGDDIHTFTCTSCGAYTISGRRVLLASTLMQGTTVTFTASP